MPPIDRLACLVLEMGVAVCGHRHLSRDHCTYQSLVKNLLILRHASTAARGADGTDFSRPLTPQGEREARAQGGFLRQAELFPHRVMTSAAVRAATTTDLIVEALARPLPVAREEALYNAPGELLLDCVQRLSEDVGTVLLVAHMPGVAELLWMLADERSDLNVNFSPCTLVAVSLSSAATWCDVVPGCGVVEWVLPPLLSD